MSENPNPNNGPAGTYDFGEQTVIINNLIAPASGVVSLQAMPFGGVITGAIQVTTKTPFLVLQSGIPNGLGAHEFKISMGEKVHTRWSLGAPQTVPNGVETAIIWNQADLNIVYVPPPFPRTTFPVPYDGLYNVSINLEIACTDALDYAILRLYKQGFEQSRFTLAGPLSNTRPFTISVPGIVDAQVGAGDFIEATLEAFSIGGAGITVDGGIANSQMNISVIDANQVP